MNDTEHNEPRAIVREIDGQLVLDDPTALAVMRAVGKHNCVHTCTMQRDRIQHFVARMTALGHTPADVVVVLLNVNTELGSRTTDALMPNSQAMWQTMRDQGLVPFARGLAGRAGIQDLIDSLDADAGEKLRVELADKIAVVVMDHGVVEVFEASVP